MLEMSKPLVGCMRELYALSEPLMHILLGGSLAPALKHALQSSDATESLIQALEQARPNQARPEQVQRSSEVRERVG